MKNLENKVNQDIGKTKSTLALIVPSYYGNIPIRDFLHTDQISTVYLQGKGNQEATPIGELFSHDDSPLVEIEHNLNEYSHFTHTSYDTVFVSCLPLSEGNIKESTIEVSDPYSESNETYVLHLNKKIEFSPLIQDKSSTDFVSTKESEENKFSLINAVFDSIKYLKSQGIPFKLVQVDSIKLDAFGHYSSKTTPILDYVGILDSKGTVNFNETYNGEFKQIQAAIMLNRVITPVEVRQFNK